MSRRCQSDGGMSSDLMCHLLRLVPTQHSPASPQMPAAFLPAFPASPLSHDVKPAHYKHDHFLPTGMWHSQLQENQMADLPESDFKQMFVMPLQQPQLQMRPPQLFSARAASTSNGPALKLEVDDGGGCAVCGDKVNGNRYGVPACLGCIVFFRRAVIRNVSYKCGKDQNCVIDCKSRCTCRFCRLQKCFTVGMRPECIQRRDMMGPRKKACEQKEIPDNHTHLQLQTPGLSESTEASPRPPSLPLSTHSFPPDTLMPPLCRLQEKQKSAHRSWFCARGPHAAHASFVDEITRLYTTGELRRARMQDINTMFHLAIVDSHEWASHFPVFSQLHTDLKREMLKEYAIAFMLIDQGFNTSRQHDQSLWILQYDRVYMCKDYMRGLSKADQQLPMASTKAKLHPDFVLEAINGVGAPMRAILIEPFECAVLKTLVLFECKNVHPIEARHEMQQLRERCLIALAAYEAVEHPQDGIERIGQLLLMIANVRCCIIATYRQISVSDVFELMSFDPLVSDVLLRKSI